LLILTFGLVPVTNGADHLDSPRVSQNGAVDITDIYAFSTSNGRKSVFVIGVNPGAGVLENSGTTFGPNVDYLLKIDTNSDLRPDVTYKWRFGSPNNMGVQSMKLWRNGSLVSSGWTGQANGVAGGGKTTGDLFDDPFFFDLAAFNGAVLGSGNGRSFCDGNEVNFFAGLNLNGIVLRVPNGFRDSAEEVLTSLGAADPEGLAAVLIPDVLTYETSNTAGFLNGRRLANDVIDAELGLVTNNAITSDCVGNDSAFPGAWPYLAPAN
jgi:hypothetical protein